MPGAPLLLYPCGSVPDARGRPAFYNARAETGYNARSPQSVHLTLQESG